MKNSIAMGCWSVLLLLCACTTSTSPVVGDSPELWAQDLFAGVNLGMQRQEFFEYCLAANARGEMAAGLDNYVRIPLEDSVIALNTVVEFFPTFDTTGTMLALPGRFYSLSWAPWNADLSGDALLDAVVAHLENTLRGEAFEVLPGAPVRTFVKIDGPRRIFVRPHPTIEQFVEFAIERGEGCPSCDNTDLLNLPPVNPVYRDLGRELQ